MRPSPDFPIRLTVCDNAHEARQAVDRLRQAGFTPGEISVVCSQETCQQEFAEFVKEQPAGSEVNSALNRAGLTALGLGAATVVAGVLTAAGTAIMIVGGFAGVAIVGTFAALMMTRGAEKELADYYDQALTHGQILVAVETDDPARQQLADELLGHPGEVAGALPRESPGT